MLFRRYVTYAGISFRVGTGVEANFTRTLADLLCTQVRVGLPLAYLLCTQVRVWSGEGGPNSCLLTVHIQVRVGPTVVCCAYR